MLDCEFLLLGSSSEPFYSGRNTGPFSDEILEVLGLPLLLPPSTSPEVFKSLQWTSSGTFESFVLDVTRVYKRSEDGVCGLCYRIGTFSVLSLDSPGDPSTVVVVGGRQGTLFFSFQQNLVSVRLRR